MLTAFLLTVSVASTLISIISPDLAELLGFPIRFQIRIPAWLSYPEATDQLIITPTNHYSSINYLDLLRSANYPSPVYPPAPPSSPAEYRMFLSHELEVILNRFYCPVHYPNVNPFGWESPPPIPRQFLGSHHLP